MHSNWADVMIDASALRTRRVQGGLRQWEIFRDQVEVRRAVSDDQRRALRSLKQRALSLQDRPSRARSAGPRCSSSVAHASNTPVIARPTVSVAADDCDARVRARSRSVIRSARRPTFIHDQETTAVSGAITRAASDRGVPRRQVAGGDDITSLMPAGDRRGGTHTEAPRGTPR